MLKLASPILIEPTAQNYHWGKVGSSSLVAQLLSDFDEQRPYAELWVGEHSRSPSTAILDEVDRKRTIRISLRELISRYPKAILGDRVLHSFGPDLPFLFKILSIEKPLSVQAHPNREQARQLYKIDPSSYPDANHKPELAIALNEVNFLYGFKNCDALKETFTRVPELVELIGKDLSLKVQSESSHRLHPDTLQAIYAAVVTAEKDVYARLSSKLRERLRTKNDLLPDEKLAAMIIEDYGIHDLGIFSVFLLNYCTMKPGEALFVKPNVLHAYLGGELAECMANSDNVVRAGITPKKQDVETLMDMLDFSRQGPPTLTKAEDGAKFHNVVSYVTPAEEFSCDSIEADNLEMSFATNASPTLIFCLKGEAEVVADSCQTGIAAGKALLIPALLADFTLSVRKGRVLMVTVP